MGIYDAPGTPPSESDPILRKKRKKALVARDRSTVTTRKIPREFEYHPSPPPAEAATVASATSYIRRRGGEHADLLLDMLGLVEPAEPAPSLNLDSMGRKKYDRSNYGKSGQAKAAAAARKAARQASASATSDKMVNATPSA